MKFRKTMSLQAPLPSSLHCWLDSELERRGIDAAVYTRYIISLLTQDNSDSLEPSFDLNPFWFSTPNSKEARHRKCDRKKADHTSRSESSSEHFNKKAVLDCLRSLSIEDSGIEDLVDELFRRLREASQKSDDDDTVLENSMEVNNEGSSTDLNEKSDVQDPAEKYYAAFPALIENGESLKSSPPTTESSSVWNSNCLKFLKSTNRDEKPVDSANNSNNFKKANNLANKKIYDDKKSKKKKHLVRDGKSYKNNVISTNFTNFDLMEDQLKNSLTTLLCPYEECSSWYTDPVEPLGQSERRLYDRGASFRNLWTYEKLLSPNLLWGSAVASQDVILDRDYYCDNFDVESLAVPTYTELSCQSHCSQYELVSDSPSDETGLLNVDLIMQSLKEVEVVEPQQSGHGVLIDDKNFVYCKTSSEVLNNDFERSVESYEELMHGLMACCSPSLSDSHSESLPGLTKDDYDSVRDNGSVTQRVYIEMLKNSPNNWAHIGQKVLDLSFRNLQSMWDVNALGKECLSDRAGERELFASEFSAFNDAIPPKIQKSDTTSSSQSDSKQFAESTSPGTPTSDGDHPYFSLRTHFCPIDIAENVDQRNSQQRCPDNTCSSDVFGGYDFNGTLYQDYKHCDSKFVPKFPIVPHEHTKSVQTGNSLEVNSDGETESRDSQVGQDEFHFDINYVLEIIDDADYDVNENTKEGLSSDDNSSLVSSSPLLSGVCDSGLIGHIKSVWDNVVESCYSSIGVWSTDDGNSNGLFQDNHLSNYGCNDISYYEAVCIPSIELQQSAFYDLQDHQWMNSNESIYPSDIVSADSIKMKNNERSYHCKRRPCSFYVDGQCSRDKCRFSHDLSSITCRFWLDGDCFKGSLCPFAHDSENLFSDKNVGYKTAKDSNMKFSKDDACPVTKSKNICKNGKKKLPRKINVFRRKTYPLYSGKSSAKNRKTS